MNNKHVKVVKEGDVGISQEFEVDHFVFHKTNKDNSGFQHCKDAPNFAGTKLKDTVLGNVFEDFGMLNKLLNGIEHDLIEEKVLQAFAVLKLLIPFILEYKGDRLAIKS